MKAICLALTVLLLNGCGAIVYKHYTYDVYVDENAKMDVRLIVMKEQDIDADAEGKAIIDIPGLMGMSHKLQGGLHGSEEAQIPTGQELRQIPMAPTCQWRCEGDSSGFICTQICR